MKKLRELILELAVRGKLVPQDSIDEPASVLLEKIAEEKARLIKEGKIKKQKRLPEISDEEKPFELPVGWEWTRLGTIALINPRNAAEDNSMVSFVPMPLVTTSHTGEHGQEEREWGRIKKGYTHFANGDIGLAKITPCFENSKAVVFFGLKNGIGAGTTELHVARPFGTTLFSRFVLLYLKSPQFLHLGQSKMTGTAGQKRVPKSFFAENPFPLPPIIEQHRIVANVDELMALCDRLEQQQTNSNTTHQALLETLLATLTTAADHDEFAGAWQRIQGHFHTLFTTEQSIDQLKQTILQLAVMGKLVPQDPEDEPASILLEKIAKEKARLIKVGKIKKQKKLQEISEEDKPFDLPRGWEWAKIGDIYHFLNGYAFKSEWFKSAGIKLLRNINILHGDTRWVDVAYVAESKARGFETYALNKGDIVLSLDRPIINTGLKYAVISEQDLPCLLLQRVAKFHSIGDYILPRFLTTWLESVFFILKIDPGRSNGVPHISTKQIGNMVFALPPLAEQHRIVAKVDGLMALCNTLKTRISEAQTTQIHLADTMVEQAVSREADRDD
ncbi:MAG: restriction endonuclease subunit S [Thermodesulfobacteriota bacterium]|nr:restriction endonuclease subunit S [Thermodesulfobacteriota bacterium]